MNDKEMTSKEKLVVDEIMKRSLSYGTEVLKKNQKDMEGITEKMFQSLNNVVDTLEKHKEDGKDIGPNELVGTSRIVIPAYTESLAAIFSIFIGSIHHHINFDGEITDETKDAHEKNIEILKKRAISAFKAGIENKKFYEDYIRFINKEINKNEK